jgi:hypothetical protein
MAKRMKPGCSLEANQVIEWIMPLRHPFHRIGVACAASHADAGALHPGQAILLSSRSSNRTRRGTNVSLGWQRHHGATLERYGLRLNPMGA